DDLAKKIEADAEARKADEAKRAEAASAEQEAQAASFATRALDSATNEDGSPVYELCAKPENRTEAVKLAIEHATQLAIARGIESETLTPDTVTALLNEAYADVEAELEAEGIERAK